MSATYLYKVVSQTDTLGCLKANLINIILILFGSLIEAIFLIPTSSLYNTPTILQTTSSSDRLSLSGLKTVLNVLNNRLNERNKTNLFIMCL